MRTIALAVALLTATCAQTTAAESNSPALLYKTHCSACHGVNLEGTQHTPLKKDRWKCTSDRSAILRHGLIISIAIHQFDLSTYTD